jgi:hypothetical protein
VDEFILVTDIKTVLRRFFFLANYTAATLTIHHGTTNTRRAPAALLLLFVVLSLLDQHNGGCLAPKDSCLCRTITLSSSIITTTSATRENSQTLNGILFARQAIPSFLYNSTQSEVTFKYSVSGTETGTYGTLKYLRQRLSGGL